MQIIGKSSTNIEKALILQFDANQEYQIEAVARLLEGLPRNEVDGTFALSGS